MSETLSEIDQKLSFRISVNGTKITPQKALGAGDRLEASHRVTVRKGDPIMVRVRNESEFTADSLVVDMAIALIGEHLDASGWQTMPSTSLNRQDGHVEMAVRRVVQSPFGIPGGNEFLVNQFTITTNCNQRHCWVMFNISASKSKRQSFVVDLDIR